MQILLITIPGFVINFTLIFWYLASVNKLYLSTVSQLLFSTILLSSDPMLTATAIRDLGRYIFFLFLYLKHHILYLTCLVLRSFVHYSLLTEQIFFKVLNPIVKYNRRLDTFFYLELTDLRALQYCIYTVVTFLLPNTSFLLKRLSLE